MTKIVRKYLVGLSNFHLIIDKIVIGNTDLLKATKSGPSL